MYVIPRVDKMHPPIRSAFGFRVNGIGRDFGVRGATLRNDTVSGMKTEASCASLHFLGSLER